MDKLQTAAVIALSLTAAARVMMFDKRGKIHKPLSAVLAYICIIWLGSLAFCAAFGLQKWAVWLLIFGLALHTGAVIYTKGNISQIHPQP